jgi:hypothetical protein
MFETVQIIVCIPSVVAFGATREQHLSATWRIPAAEEVVARNGDIQVSSTPARLSTYCKLRNRHAHY